MAEEDRGEGVKVLTKPASSSVRRWTCQLCAQSRNTEDLENCKTCGRPRGHNPERYRQRLKEIRQWNVPQDYDGGYEASSWGDSWGLIIGLILLFVIVGLLAWAFYEDQKDAMQDTMEL
mmetsp:Transcript_89422/g.154806  ORF Transcript_89422/g.154806 Transcript_89422/m.154806 type:complete len:119 (-) Transcript_89422:51-407(-)